MMSTGVDRRIVYGATCTWWGSIQDVARRGDLGLPCCPHCRGLLLEVPDLETWNRSVAAHDAKEPGYAEFIAWLRGRCYRTDEAAEGAYWAHKMEGGS